MLLLLNAFYCSASACGNCTCFLSLSLSFFLDLMKYFYKFGLVGPGSVAQWLRSLPCTPRDHIWALVLIPAAPLPFQLPACGLGKQSRTAQSLGTLHPRGRPGRGSWLWIGLAPAIAVT